MNISARPDVHPDFPSRFRGAVLRPGDATYEEARAVFQGRIPEQAGPAVIAQCVDEDDVATALRYAHERGIPIAVRSGGHDADGNSMPPAGLVVDLSQLRGITVDPDTRVVRAQPGVLLRELDAATQQHGLAVPAGTSGDTGLGGLTLGGGIGHLMRRYGATVDNLLACEMITVNGRNVRADETENRELFWALCGGGGNFGVVTAFEYRAQPVGPEVVTGMVMFPFDQAADILDALPLYMRTAPRELGLTCMLGAIPPLPMLPQEMHGQLALTLLPVYSGDPADADAVLEPLIDLGRPLVNLVEKKPWVQANDMFAGSLALGMRVNQRGGYLSDLSAEFIDTVLNRIAAAPRNLAGMVMINLWALGGAISDDVAEDATAFSREGARWIWDSGCMWTGPEHDRQYDEWTAGLVEALRRHTLPNGYINLAADQGPEWRRGVHGSDAKHRRLRAVKTAWDPKNLLRHNKNITPYTDDHPAPG